MGERGQWPAALNVSGRRCGDGNLRVRRSIPSQPPPHDSARDVGAVPAVVGFAPNERQSGTSRKDAIAWARSGMPTRAQASFPDRNRAITEIPLIRGLVVPTLFRDSPQIGARTDCPGHHQLVRKPSNEALHQPLAATPYHTPKHNASSYRRRRQREYRRWLRLAAPDRADANNARDRAVHEPRNDQGLMLQLAHAVLLFYIIYIMRNLRGCGAGSG